MPHFIIVLIFSKPFLDKNVYFFRFMKEYGTQNILSNMSYMYLQTCSIDLHYEVEVMT